MRIGLGCANDQVGDPVAIYIAGVAHTDSGTIAVRGTDEFESVRAGQVRDIERCGEGRSLSEDDVGRAFDGGGGSLPPIVADDHVVHAIAVDVACATHREGTQRAGGRAGNLEAGRAVERREAGRRGKEGRFAKDYVNSVARSADDHISETVAIHIGGAERPSGLVSRHGDELEAVCAVECREVEGRVEAIRGAEDDIRASCAIERTGGLDAGGTDDQVVHAVAIHIAGGMNREAGAIVGGEAGELEAVRARERAEGERRSDRGTGAVRAGKGRFDRKRSRSHFAHLDVDRRPDA